MSDSMFTDWEATTAEQVKEAEEGDLFPTGTYEGIVQGWTTKQVDSERAPRELFGKHIARVTADLFTDGKTRKFFFDAAPGIQKADGGLHPVSKTAAQLAKHTGTIGQPFGESLEASKSVRLKFRLRLTPANEEKGYSARNWLDAITSA